MTFPTLPSNPSPDTGIERQQKPNYKVAEMGDGYSQRATFGRNQTKLTLPLMYTNITKAEKETLENFILTNAADGQTFLWKMPDENQPRKWYLDSWTVRYVKFGVFNVTMNLVESFDIG